jgi:hypothetical protein
MKVQQKFNGRKKAFQPKQYGTIENPKEVGKETPYLNLKSCIKRTKNVPWT